MEANAVHFTPKAVDLDIGYSHRLLHSDSNLHEFDL